MGEYDYAIVVVYHTGGTKTVGFPDEKSRKQAMKKFKKDPNVKLVKKAGIK